MKPLLPILTLLVFSCVKETVCPNIGYEKTYYSHKWEVLKKEIVMTFKEVCEYREYTDRKQDTACGEFATYKWIILK